MDQIHLPAGIWHIDISRPLGKPGGFGAVFLGESAHGEQVAIKRLHLTTDDAGHRELAIAEELQNLQSEHVMPVIDAGQDANSDRYYVVMPVAEESLQDFLNREGAVEDASTAAILIQIAMGLADAPSIVHRDLKPANILLLNGRWHVADFGIARFAEESTSLRTLQGYLTPQFAAPEQWQLQRATAATDVYALGCIAYFMLAGELPFKGSNEELREQHLNTKPQNLTDVSPILRSLVSMMLRKVPASRPSVGRIREILEQFQQGTGDPDPNLEGLAAAAARHEDRLSAEEARRQRESERRAARSALAEEARGILEECYTELAHRISSTIPSADVRQSSESWQISVAGATLELHGAQGTSVISDGAFPRSEWDVICGGTIGVADPSGTQRGASLWYTRRRSPSADSRWYEVAYRGNPLSGHRFEYEPAAATPELADRAHSNAIDVVTICYSPTPIDDEDLNDFCRRWIYILTKAGEGSLSQLPQSLPTIE